MNEYNMGGLIPDPLSDLRRRIEKLEARIAELESHIDVLGKEISLIQRDLEKKELEKGKDEPEPGIKITQDKTGWTVRIGEGVIPEVFSSLKEAAQVVEEILSKPEPEQWKPYPIYFNFESIVPHPQAQWMEEKLTRYAKQLQWLYTNYPEQNGEWGKDTQWFVYFYDDDEEWVTSADYDYPPLNLIYMSLGAAEHLREDMNSGKVRF